jgi:hypothetical protein
MLLGLVDSILDGLADHNLPGAIFTAPSLAPSVLHHLYFEHAGLNGTVISGLVMSSGLLL